MTSYKQIFETIKKNPGVDRNKLLAFDHATVTLSIMENMRIIVKGENETYFLDEKWKDKFCPFL